MMKCSMGGVFEKISWMKPSDELLVFDR